MCLKAKEKNEKVEMTSTSQAPEENKQINRIWSKCLELHFKGRHQENAKTIHRMGEKYLQSIGTIKDSYLECIGNT